METELIDRIYEASFIPEHWPGVLSELATIADAEGGLLFSARDRVLSWTTTDNMAEVFSAYVNDGWFARCGRRVCMFNHAHSAFLIENDYWTEDELQANPIYNDFFRPRNLGWSAGTGLLMPTGDKIVFSVERTLDQGPMEKEYVGRLNTLRPHLARSAMIAARLGLKSAQGASEALSILGLPILLLTADGNVVETNNLPDSLSDHLSWTANDRFSLKDTQANTLFAVALKSLGGVHGSDVQSFPVRDKDNQPVYVAHLVPIKRSVIDIFSGSYAVLVLVPVAANNVPPVELVRSLFDLTASEARVARGIAAGKPVEEIAVSGNVALTTVRTQLRRVMEKTGCSRQAELAALLAGITLKNEDT